MLMNDIDDPEKYPDSVVNMTDKQYYEWILKSIDQPYIRGIKMPGFPDEQIQKQFTGSSKRQALREGYNFYLQVKKYCKSLGVPLTSDAHILDFGCGWGRIARFFFKDISSENFYGIDVDPEMIDFCTTAMGHGTYLRTTPEPPTAFEENGFDVIYAYSVFSHLEEQVANNWIKEFARILKPGGILLATTQRRSFLDFCESLRTKKVGLESGWHQALAKSFIPVKLAKRNYDEGKFLIPLPPVVGGFVTLLIMGKL